MLAVPMGPLVNPDAPSTATNIAIPVTGSAALSLPMSPMQDAALKPTSFSTETQATLDAKQTLANQKQQALAALRPPPPPGGAPPITIPVISTGDLLKTATPTQIAEILQTAIDAKAAESALVYPRITLDGPIPEFTINDPNTLQAAGQSPGAAGPAQAANQPDPLTRARYPTIEITNGYLNNPIEFVATQPFFDTSVTVQVSEDVLPQYPRDIAQFVTVQGGVTSLVYSVPQTSPLYDRLKIGSTIDSTFGEF